MDTKKKQHLQNYNISGGYRGVRSSSDEPPFFPKWSTYFSTVPCTVLVVSLENRIRWLQIFNCRGGSCLLTSLQLEFTWKACSMATKSQNWTETRNNAHRTQPHPLMHAAAVLVVCWCNMAGIIKMQYLQEYWFISILYWNWDKNTEYWFWPQNTDKDPMIAIYTANYSDLAMKKWSWMQACRTRYLLQSHKYRLHTKPEVCDQLVLWLHKI